MSEAREPLAQKCCAGSSGIPTRMTVAAGIFLAVLLRLILMPISLHGDLLYIHSMPPVMVSEGAWNIFKYFGSFGAQHGFIHYPPLVGYMTAFSECLCGMISGSFHSFITQFPTLTLADAGIDRSVFFEQQTLGHRLLFAFLMKSAYLFFDLACGLLIYFSYRNEKGLGWFGLLSAWMFHPVLLYGTYIFGQHRIFSAFFVWLTVFLLRKNRPAWACFAFGWILLLDNFGFIVFPFFITAVSGNFKTMAKHAAIALIPFALVFVPMYIDSEGYAAYAYLAPQWVFQATQPIFPSIPYSALVLKTVFAVALCYVLFLLLKNLKTGLSAAQRLQMVMYTWCVVLLVFYSSTMVSVHYFVWILPFFLILSREGVPWPKYLNPVLIFLLFFFNLDSRGQNLGLFSPLSPGASSLLSLHEIMAPWIPWGKLIGSSRMAFTVLCLFMAWQLLDKRIKPLLHTAGHENPMTGDRRAI